MDLIKIINKKTGVVKEVKKSLASDYVGTGEFELYTEPKKMNKNVEVHKYSFRIDRKEESDEIRD